MSDVPENAPSHCPGTKSDSAGKASACEGCPNRSICSSGQLNQPDPSLGEIKLRLAGVKHKILVLSGKGGVGKSTVTSHLAYALAENPEKQVAILDVDICGPSQPVILGVQNEQVHQSAAGWSPVYVRDNLAVMSIGFLLPNASDAVIWRGPRKNGIIKQFLKDVDWTSCSSDEVSGASLDYLIIDTPPGTSDEHLTVISLLIESGLISSLNTDGAILVTTPQEVALLDVRKQIDFCQRSKLPILGVVENMSGFECPKCRTRTEIFAPTSGGAAKMCEQYGLKLLGRIPLHQEVARACDTGRSFLDSVDNAAHAPVIDAFRKIVQEVTCIVGESA